MRYVLCAVFFFFHNSSLANCEAGGYQIHTTASYKQSNDIIFAILNNNIIQVSSVDYSGGIEKRLAKNFTLFHGNKRCGTGTIKIDGKDPYDRPMLKMDMRGCIQTKGTPGKYISINLMNNVIKISKPLKATASNLKSGLKKRMHNKLLSLKLLSSSDYGGEQSITIDHSDILNLKNYDTSVTSVGKNFKMLVAKLSVKNVAKYFSDTNYSYYGKEYMKFANLKIEYPVIFFNSGKRLKFAGDGSHCSTASVMNSNMALVNRLAKNKDPLYKPKRGRVAKTNEFPRDANGLYDLGYTDRFKITNAFDMNGDSQVDILEINNRFAYRILPNLELEVINVGMGC